MKTIVVKAPEGRIYPIEGQPRQHIEQEPIEVEETAYYRRALADGDLVVVQPTPAASRRTSTPEA